MPLPCGDYGSDTFLKSVKLKRLKSNIEIFVLKDFVRKRSFRKFWYKTRQISKTGFEDLGEIFNIIS